MGACELGNHLKILSTRLTQSNCLGCEPDSLPDRMFRRLTCRVLTNSEGQKGPSRTTFGFTPWCNFVSLVVHEFRTLPVNLFSICGSCPPLNTKKAAPFLGPRFKRGKGLGWVSQKRCKAPFRQAKRLKERCRKQMEESEGHWLVRPLLLMELKCTCAAKRRSASCRTAIESQLHANMMGYPGFKG